MISPENTNLPLSRFIKTFTLHSLGCAKNQVDSEEIISFLSEKGYIYTEDADKADLFIVNTCGFIREAKTESLEETLALRRKYPSKKIIIAGCLSQRYAKELEADFPEADGIFGNSDLSLISEIVSRVGSGERAVLVPSVKPSESERRQFLGFPGSVYVKIAEGCDNRCTYCAIPLIRGNVRSRTEESVFQECGSLADKGVKEIILIAQDLSSYGLDQGGRKLPELLERILSLKGDFWLRLLYIHPDHFPMDILPLFNKDSRLIPYFDIPFQHASASVLSRMGRRGSGEAYLDLINKIRTEVPDSVIRSTFMAGFPGEKAPDIHCLETFISKAELDWAGFFAYSREEGTPAYNFKGSASGFLGRTSVNRRVEKLKVLQEEVTLARMERFTGRELDVLMEEQVKGESLTLGRAYLHAPDVDGLVVVKGLFAPGSLIRCRIQKRNGIDLEGEPVRCPR